MGIGRVVATCRVLFDRGGSANDDDNEIISARTCCTREVRVGTFTFSFASLEELRACQCSCHRRRTFVSSLPVSKSGGEIIVLILFAEREGSARIAY